MRHPAAVGESKTDEMLWLFGTAVQEIVEIENSSKKQKTFYKDLYFLVTILMIRASRNQDGFVFWHRPIYGSSDETNIL
jgi:hypothetical protein